MIQILTGYSVPTTNFSFFLLLHTKTFLTFIYIMSGIYFSYLCSFHLWKNFDLGFKRPFLTFPACFWIIIFFFQFESCFLTLSDYFFQIERVSLSSLWWDFYDYEMLSCNLAAFAVVLQKEQGRRRV